MMAILTRGFPLSASGDANVPKNMFADLWQVPRLKMVYEEKQLKGELEKLVSMLDVEDNPIVMICKFK